jgi:hypothetical protein
MSKVTFECLNLNGQMFTVSMVANTEAIETVIATTVQAYQRSGIEVISATRVEELVVDVNLYAPAPRREMVSSTALQWLAGRGGKIMQGGAAFGALALSVIGFDDGFSILSFSHHLTLLAEAVPSLMHMIHLA